MHSLVLFSKHPSFVARSLYPLDPSPVAFIPTNNDHTILNSQFIPEFPNTSDLLCCITRRVYFGQLFTWIGVYGFDLTHGKNYFGHYCGAGYWFQQETFDGALAFDRLTRIVRSFVRFSSGTSLESAFATFDPVTAGIADAYTHGSFDESSITDVEAGVDYSNTKPWCFLEIDTTTLGYVIDDIQIVKNYKQFSGYLISGSLLIRNAIRLGEFLKRRSFHPSAVEDRDSQMLQMRTNPATTIATAPPLPLSIEVNKLPPSSALDPEPGLRTNGEKSADPIQKIDELQKLLNHTAHTQARQLNSVLGEVERLSNYISRLESKTELKHNISTALPFYVSASLNFIFVIVIAALYLLQYAGALGPIMLAKIDSPITNVAAPLPKADAAPPSQKTDTVQADDNAGDAAPQDAKRGGKIDNANCKESIPAKCAARSH